MGLTSCQVLDDLVQGLQDAALGLKCDLGLGKQLEDVAAGERGDQLGSGNLMASPFQKRALSPLGGTWRGQPLRQEPPGPGSRWRLSGPPEAVALAALGRDGRAAPDLGAVVWGRAGRGLLHLGGNGVSVST